ncbi:hypothetical protein BVX97_04240 [bacterium E08(2017)]|nr:hypothetical protein BVX97_04240 [bacterium E08(2017)]
MRIVFVNQFYLPDDAPTALYLRDLAIYLKEHGHDVTVICSRGSYRGREQYDSQQMIDGITVRRIGSSMFSMRSKVGALLRSLSFHKSILGEFRKEDLDADIVISMSSPPLIGLAVRKAALARGWKTGHWVLNILPGALWERKEREQIKDADLVWTIGNEMAAKLHDYGASNVETVPLWVRDGMVEVEEEARQKFRQDRGWGDDELVIMYSGNMGMAHSFDDIEKAVRKTGEDSSIRWAFFGDGKESHRLKSLAVDCKQAEYHDYAPAEKIAEHLASADIQLVTLKSTWDGCAIPCKIQNIMQAGSPVIFIGPEENSIADWLTESGAGWVVREGNTEALIKAIEEARDEGLRRSMGKKAEKLAGVMFDINSALERIRDFIEKVS